MFEVVYKLLLKSGSSEEYMDGVLHSSDRGSAE